MKKLITVQEIEGQGLEALLGQKVTFFCLNYIYAGKLIGVNKEDIILEDAYLVFDTGDFQSKGFADAQFLAKEFRLRTTTIESYGVLANK